jgi:hypothetical protein
LQQPRQKHPVDYDQTSKAGKVYAKKEIIMVEDSYICYSTCYNFQKIIPAFFFIAAIQPA